MQSTLTTPNPNEASLLTQVSQKKVHSETNTISPSYACSDAARLDRINTIMTTLYIDN